MKTPAQRAHKRHGRENRDNKGVNAESLRQRRAAQIKAAHDTIGYPNCDYDMLLAAAALVGKKAR